MLYFAIAILLILMLASLGYSLLAMIKDDGSSMRNVKGLTFRVAIWVVLFLFIMFGMYTGKIDPSNSINKSLLQQSSQNSQSNN